MKHVFTQIIELYQKYTRSVKGIYRKKGIRPGTDWKVIVVTFFLGMIVVAGINLFIYIQVKNNAWWKTDEAGTVYQVRINQKGLQDVLVQFEEQKNKLESFKTSVPTISDPSL